MYKNHTIVLASKSPRRKSILEQAGISAMIVGSDASEEFPATIPVEEVPEFIAANKAVAVRNRPLYNDPSMAILAADTIVILKGRIIGKPVDRKDAIEILQALSGKTHSVVTGVCLLYKGKNYSFRESTLVNFHALSVEQIEYYVDACHPFDKAGAYAIQEWIGAVGVAGIEGDYYNVMGLPISRLVKILVEVGILHIA